MDIISVSSALVMQEFLQKPGVLINELLYLRSSLGVHCIRRAPPIGISFRAAAIRGARPTHSTGTRRIFDGPESRAVGTRGRGSAQVPYNTRRRWGTEELVSDAPVDGEFEMGSGGIAGASS